MNLNHQLFFDLYNLAHRSDTFSGAVTFMGGIFSWIVGGLALVFLGYFFVKSERLSLRELWEWLVESVTVFLTVFSAWLVSFIIKILAHAPRPFVIFSEVHPSLSETTHSSFPSGHATIFFALAMAIYLYNKPAGVIFFLFALLISLARVAAGIHFPLDILAGAFIGAAVAYGIHRALRRLMVGRVKKNGVKSI